MKALQGWCGKQASKFDVVLLKKLKKALNGTLHLKVVEKW